MYLPLYNLQYKTVEAYTASWIEILGGEAIASILPSRLIQPRGLKCPKRFVQPYMPSRGLYSLVD